MMSRQNFFDFSVDALDGSKGLLQGLHGKAVLAVNVASQCGYTPQYAGLQGLYEELQDQNFAVVGFPCNQFGAQEPGTAADIRTFCTTTYGVSFPLAAKVDVLGPGQHPLFAWLTSAVNGFAGDIEWNFEKFLISPAGRLVARYPSATKPRDTGLLQDLAELI
jgi:glutathione peroxidase